VEIDNIEDEVAYQSDGMSPVLPVAEIESISCLRDCSQVDVFEEIFDQPPDCREGGKGKD
jgi:hypothetical protein